MNHVLNRKWSAALQDDAAPPEQAGSRAVAAEPFFQRRVCKVAAQDEKQGDQQAAIFGQPTVVNFLGVEAGVVCGGNRQDGAALEVIDCVL